MLAPDYRAARYDYVLALLRRHKHVQALEETREALELDPTIAPTRPPTPPRASGSANHERRAGALP